MQLEKRKSKLKFETRGFERGRAIVIEAEPDFARIRLKGLRHSIDVSWEGIYHFAAKVYADRLRREKNERTEPLEKLAGLVDDASVELNALRLRSSREIKVGYQNFIRAYIHPRETPQGEKGLTSLLGAASILGVPVRFVDPSTADDTMEDGEAGRTGVQGILIRWTGNHTGMAATLAHELAHALAHFGNPRYRPGTLAELQAESVAYVVCNLLGFDKPEARTYLAAEGVRGANILAQRYTIERIADRLIKAVESFRNSAASYNHKEIPPKWWEEIAA